MKGRVYYLYLLLLCAHIFNGRALSLCASITKWAKKLETTSRRKAHKRKHGTVKRCTNRHYSDMGVVNITTF